MIDDERYMLRAVELARAGEGHVSPNPMVGAVVVCHGKIIGEGAHLRYGGPHAEVNAINSVADKSLLPDSTIYVTLEPCSHYGKTPPCAKLLIDMGIKRVVVGTLDSFPAVSGRGVNMLREAGIEVVTGVLEDECREVNKRFITAHTTGMPWVQLKWAQTADGYIASTDGKPIAISTLLSLTLMHHERSIADAIVVGANTVKTDDPSLTTRLWHGKSPLRVVLDANNTIPLASKVLTDGALTLIFNSTISRKQGNVEWVRMSSQHPCEWLKALYQRGVISVMVEGGANVLGQMLSAGTWNEARVEVSSQTVGNGIPAPTIDLEPNKIEKLSKNTLLLYHNHVKKV